MSTTRLRISIQFEVVTEDGGTIRSEQFGSVVPAATEADTFRLAGAVSNTVLEELPRFLGARK